jgi:hypothetical protein
MQKRCFGLPRSGFLRGLSESWDWRSSALVLLLLMLMLVLVL